MSHTGKLEATEEPQAPVPGPRSLGIFKSETPSQTQPSSSISKSAMKSCLCNTSPQGGKGLSWDSVTFRECCFTGFGDTEATSHGMQTRCGFLTVSAALNKRVPSSQGIETTQFHSVLLCCQLAFNIPLSPQKPQHDPLHGCCTIGAFIPVLAPATLG